jgi:DNA-binding IclR family transcriptional regulator
MSDERTARNRVQSVERSIDILLALANGARTLTDVAKATGLSKGTAFRLLASLNHEQLVIRDPNDTAYMLGPGILRMFQGAMTNLGGIATPARPALQELWSRTDETVTLHVRIGYERICVAEFPSTQALRYSANLGASAPLHVGSAGKVLMALLEPEELERALSNMLLNSVTYNTITNRDQLREELEVVRRRGWAMSEGERIVGAAAISVPVRGPGMFAALSVLGPTERMNEQVRLEMLPEMQRIAATIEAALGRSDAGTSRLAASGQSR